MEITNIILSIISFSLGFISGLIVSSYFKKHLDQDRYKNIVLIVIVVMWATSVAVEIVNPEYKTNPLIHGLMGSIVGFFYKFEPKK